MMPSPLFAVLVAGLTLSAAGGTCKRDFEQDPPGQPPTGFRFGHTAGRGAPGRWLVVQEQENRFLAQLDPEPTRSRFPVAVLADVKVVDVDLSVRLRPMSGEVDRAGGIVWRFQDENHYYLVRANALEHNVVVYKVQDGKRTDLPVKGEGRTYGKPAEVAAGGWSTLRVLVTGDIFEVYWNDRKLYEVEDSTFRQPGLVGVWTKADSVTHFDDLIVLAR
jgi:hypothetical protein